MKWRKSEGQGFVNTTEREFGANDRIPQGREAELADSQGGQLL